MRAANRPVLGLSVSDPPVDELTARRLNPRDVHRAVMDVIDWALKAGWTVAYGGDLRPGGFTTTLLDIARTRPGGGSTDVSIWLPWPASAEVTAQQETDLRDRSSGTVTVVRCPPPPGASSSLPPPGERSSGQRLLAADGLRLMREEMTRAIDARVVIGGRLAGQQGLVAGIVEEAALGVVCGVPLLVAGGLGGAGRVVTEALSLTAPVELTVDYQLAHTPGYPELLDVARAAGRAYDPVAALLLADRDSLGNGLDHVENQRLAVSGDVDEIVELITAGLDRLHTTRDTV